MKKTHSLDRRDFLKSGLASLGILATDGLPVFAVSPDWNPKKKPNLTFGVVSDTHMRCHYDGKRFYSRYDVFFDDQALVEVMKLFKKEGVDAILHCGDVTDNGMVREMEFYKEAWDKVYGADPRPVNMICTGNHDVAESYYYTERIDYIYVSRGTKVLDYKTIASPRLGTKLYPSDHFPSVATLVFEGDEKPQELVRQGAER